MNPKTMFIVDSLVNDKLTKFIKDNIVNSPYKSLKMKRGQISDDSFYYIQVNQKRFLYSDQTEREVDFAKLSSIIHSLIKETVTAN